VLEPADRLWIYVVDNESTETPPADLPAAVTVLCQEQNLGYGGGNNVGATRALADHPDLDALFILNNDAIIEGASLKRLMAALADDPGLAVAAPVLVLPDGSLESAGGHFGWWRTWWTRFDPRQPVEFVSGAALLVRRTAWEAAGGFDLRYFHYVEDVDLGWTLTRRGWRIRVIDGARVVHQKSKSPTMPGILAYYNVRNPILFWRKTRALRAVGLNSAFRILRFLVPVRKMLKGDVYRIPWAWRGLFHGLAGRTGPYPARGRTTRP
jgi:GT2 family glycosyltransferase